MPIIFFLFMETLSCPRCKRGLDAVTDEFSVPKTDSFSFFFFFFSEHFKNKRRLKQSKDLVRHLCKALT